MAEHDNNEREEIYSKAVRAGKRTYFFDVKATRGNDYYLTITESKKYFEDDKPFYKKHKLFLYKEDFDKFMDGLNETVDYIRQNQETTEGSSERSASSASSASTDSTESKPTEDSSSPNADTKNFTDLDFEDLGSGDDDTKS
jgi:hypothetical protein